MFKQSKMENSTASIKRVLLLGFMLFPLFGWAQKAQKKDLEAIYHEALVYFDAFQNDSVQIILDELIEELEESDALNSTFGLNALLKRAEATERIGEDEEAINLFLKLIDLCREKEEWTTLAEAQISIARLFEKIQSYFDALLYLEKAREVILTHQLDSIYPRFAIRLSSAYRFYQKKDSAVYYAKEVIRTAQPLKQIDQLATGHMLMGHFVSDGNPITGIYHYQFAANLYRKINNFAAYAAMLNNIASIYLSTNNSKQALLYNDSSLLAVGKTKEEQYHYLLNKAETLNQIGRYDSAYHYLKLGHYFALREERKKNDEKVFEVEERYKDKKKAEMIQAQQSIIQLEKQRRNSLVGIIFLILVIGSILIYYTMQLRKVNRKTQEQAQIIKKANEDLATSLQQQIILQGEVHHRVKNNLQVLISLLELQSEEIEDERALKSLDAMSKRIYSIAAIHEILHQKQGAKMVNLLEYTQNLCKHFSTFLIEQEKPFFQIDIGNRLFNLETLMPLGIILNELLTNSFKYAKDKSKQLQIAISLKEEEDGFLIHYRDNGPGFPRGRLHEREGGLGTYLLKSMSRQLNGYLESQNDQGATYRIFFKEKNNQQHKAA